MTQPDESLQVPEDLEEEIKKLQKMEKAFKLLVRLQEMNQQVIDLSPHADYVEKLGRLNIEQSVAKFATLRSIASQHLEQFIALLLFSFGGSSELEKMTEEEMAGNLKLMAPVTNKLVPVISLNLFKTEFEKLGTAREKEPLQLEPVYLDTAEPVVNESLRLEIEKRFDEHYKKFREKLSDFFIKEISVPANHIISHGTKKERIERLLSLLYCLQNGVVELSYRAGKLMVSLPDQNGIKD